MKGWGRARAREAKSALAPSVRRRRPRHQARNGWATQASAARQARMAATQQCHPTRTCKSYIESAKIKNNTCQTHRFMPH
eukprot:6889172-Pyramimonas_sp.AAC.1